MRVTIVFLLVLMILPTAVQAQETQSRDCVTTPNSNGCTAGLPTVQYQFLLDQMAVNPQPDVEPLEPNTDELYKFAFRNLVNPNGITVYDAPNGNPIHTIPNKTTQATTQGYQPGWVMIAPGEWVQEGDTQVVQPSEFTGVQLNEHSLRHTLAWVLLPEYPAPYPGAQGDRSRDRIERYTRVNIYAEAEVDGWVWYLVGPEAWIKQTSIGKVTLTERPEGVKGAWIAADLYEQVLVLYDEDDRPIFATLMSSGEPGYNTDTGTFQTWQRMRADAMSGAIGRTDFYDIDFVPWVLYFDESIAIHAVFWHDKFGYRASRGCLGLSITDAYWVYHWTAEHGYEQPFVHVYSSGQYVGE